MPNPNPLQRGPKPGQSKQNQSPPAKKKKVITTGGKGNSGGSGSGGHSRRNNYRDQPPEGQPPETLPWLNTTEVPDPHPTASFVEYLRWMRDCGSDYKDPSKVQILQMAMVQADYRDRLKKLTDRTRLIAGEGNHFSVVCPWRIRVGGHRGPENILLPAFDATGMPYIPASSLRGVARASAIRQFMKDDPNLSWKDAAKKSDPYFGSLDADKCDRTGKVIFLDAYPLATQEIRSGGLHLDMVNNIWQWQEDGNLPEYKSNPNPFYSLKGSTFLIGIRPRTDSPENLKVLRQIRIWLESGLQAGIGSQINTGYGQLVSENVDLEPKQIILQVDFAVEGQLIHGYQKFRDLNRPYKWDFEKNDWKVKKDKFEADTVAVAESRASAFKSMLRYWFRAFASGVLPIGSESTLKDYLKAIRAGQNATPPPEARAMESLLFGAIKPQTRGWVTVRIEEGEIREEPKKRSNSYGFEEGRLMILLSSETPTEQEKAVKQLISNLTWIMFHLGGIGQGARRPRYSRKDRPNPRRQRPYYRGNNLIPNSDDKFWTLTNDVETFKQSFQKRIRVFHEALGQITNKTFDLNQSKRVGQVSDRDWSQVVDANAQIVVCTGNRDNKKPYALAILHDEDLKIEIERNGKKEKKYDRNLCGNVSGNKATPSPVWVNNLSINPIDDDCDNSVCDEFQVVTVFGATHNPRKKYLQELRERSHRYLKIWPLR
ncbi:MAG: type III-B CRISPR module RAMP protein Cmr6 [Cyanobacteria bacterium P01_G01_bin.54]